MRRALLSIVLSFTLLSPHGVLVGKAQDREFFNDVGYYHEHHDAIAYMWNQGWVEGFEDGGFHPDQALNRVEALAMITRASEREFEDANIELDFPDLNEGAWYYQDVQNAVAYDIMDGHEDGTFRPEFLVNEAQALKILENTFQIGPGAIIEETLPLEETTELEETLPIGATEAVIEETEDLIEETVEWWEPYFDYAFENNITVPKTEDWDFELDKELTRGEMAELIYRAKLNPYSGVIEFGVSSFYGYSFDGANTASGTPLEINGFMAAHKTLPFGTVVKVTNLDTNLSVEVTIVDRGPYVVGRILDLTPGAFEAIGWLGSGLLHTRMEVLQ